MIVSFRKLRRCDGGTTIMEFGLVAPVMMLMLMGFFDLGHSMYVRSVLQGAIEKAARDSTLEAGATNTTALDDNVKAQVRPIAGKWATYAVTRKSYSSFSNVGMAETYTDTNGNGVRNTGECYQDVNGNSTYDTDMGKAGQGGASDVVLYTITVSYPRMFPLYGLLRWPRNVSISGSTVLRNQPYSVQNFPSVTICT